MAKSSISLQPLKFKTGLDFFDKALGGGGLTPGQVILFGGAAGVGKSTFLLQLTVSLAKQKRKTLYLSYEQSTKMLIQIATRNNLPVGVGDKYIHLKGLSDHELSVDLAKNVDLIIIDSLQTAEVGKAKAGSLLLRICHRLQLFHNSTFPRGRAHRRWEGTVGAYLCRELHKRAIESANGPTSFANSFTDVHPRTFDGYGDSSTRTTDTHSN